MSRICQITGKKAMVGNHVSHSKSRVKRKFHPNLATRKFYLEEEDRWITLKVSTSGMRLINKKGLKVALEDAKKNGYINNI
ncbi:MAG: 50S ribosomal protein L28 [Bacteroidota bacterium]|nr:50S ribosomal protein L28 [Bacteroidota bacterium]